MKQIIYLLVSLTLFASCSKDNNTVETPTVRATISYAGDPAADGLGWILKITEDSLEVPANLPNEFKRQDLAVDVAYSKTDKTFPCRCAAPRYMVQIISISKAK